MTIFHRTSLIARRVLTAVALATVAGVAAPAAAQAPPRIPIPQDAPARYHELPPLRVQADQQQAWVEARLDRVLPQLMAEYDVDMWILSMREYAEDPVFWSVTAPTTFAARRRSIYVFTLRDDGSVERLALGGGTQGGLYEAYRSQRPVSDMEGDGAGNAELVGNEQWQLLREVVEDRDPANIVLNIDEVQAFSDGLHAGEREALEQALGPYAERVRREPRLAVDYIAGRIPEMMPRYREVMETVHAMLSRAFSSAVITPGETTVDDVRWWLREEVQRLGMTTWFHPSVSVQRADELPQDGPTVIRRGDLLWVDFGVVAMNLHTDTQHLGYVLREGETEAPSGLRQCLATSNRLQDILLAEMEPGRTGNEILAEALAVMRSEGIDGTIYTHPIGDHGHGAGPLIGRWDAQEGVGSRGDVVLRPATWHSIELQSTSPIPEWNGRTASCRQEEEAYLDEQGARHWVFRRQEDFHLVW